MQSETLGRLDRRTLLKGAATLIVAAVTPTTVFGVNGAWAATPANLDADTFATLVQMSRDTYPHDQIDDSFYAKAVAGLDDAAGKDAAVKQMLTDGVAALNKAAQGLKASDYRSLSSEDERVALLKAMETDPFFQKVRGNLVTGLYNNQDMWKVLGYEGESASKGGYINRGFNDIDWL